MRRGEQPRERHLNGVGNMQKQSKHKKDNDKGRTLCSAQLFTAAKTRIKNNWLGTSPVEEI